MGKSKAQEVFSIQRAMLSITGIWPIRKASKIYKTLQTFVIFILATATNISLLLNFYSKLEKSSQKFQASFLSVDFICYQVKLTLFYMKRNNFLQLLDDLEDPLLNSYSKEYNVYFNNIIRITKLIVKMFLCSCIVTISSFLVLPLFEKRNSIALPLPFPTDLVKDSQLLYVCVYIFQSMALIIGAWNSVAFDNLASSMMGIVSAQLRILNKTLIANVNPSFHHSSEEIFRSCDKCNYTIYNKLKICVKQHNAIIQYDFISKSVEDIFKYGFLMQFLTSIAIICFTGFIFATTQPGSPQFLFSISFFGSLMIEIAIACVYGNDVIIQSLRISDACYMTEWVDCDTRVRQILYMIMERSKRPLNLTAGKFVSLSLSSLIGILRSAFSYAAVLRQLYIES